MPKKLTVNAANKRDATKIIDLCDEIANGTVPAIDGVAQIRALAVAMDARTGRRDPTKRRK